jgi:ribosomal protein L40E
MLRTTELTFENTTALLLPPTHCRHKTPGSKIKGKYSRRFALQTCSNCNAISPDTARECSSCQANLLEFSSTSVALKNIIANPRISTVLVNAAGDCCPLCDNSRGTFAKEAAPHLPHQGCSHEHGCRCTYEPILIDIYP